MRKMNDATLALVASIATWTGVFAAVLATIGGFISALSSAEKDRRADLREKQAEVRIVEALRGAAEANSAANKAKQETAELAVRAAGLEAEAATARLETEKLKAQTSWRYLTPKATKEISQKLSIFKGQKFEPGAADDRESVRLAYSLVEALENAGWEKVPPDHGAHQTTGDRIIGFFATDDFVTIAFNQDRFEKTLRPRAKLLAGILDKSGIEANIRHDPSVQEPTFWIIVGNKKRVE